MVGGLLLTGGSSLRMGRDKASIHFGGLTLAERAAVALSEVAGPVIEVGPGGSGLEFVHEEPPGGGPLAAVVAGAWALRERGHAGAVLVLATDMPFVEPPLLELLANHRSAGTVIPVAQGRDQPLCARYSATALDVAIGVAESGARSMRALLDVLDDVTRLRPKAWRAVAPVEAFVDLDTPRELERALARRDG